MDERTLGDLERLTDLRERGIITDAEFQAAKSRLMGRLPLAPVAIAEPLPAARFDLLAELTKGEGTAVWKARDRVTGQLAALKVRSPGADAASFALSAAMAKKLNSPAIAQVIGAGVQDNGSPFLAMEYVEGLSLRSYLRARGRLTWQETFPIADQVLQALETAHEAGVLHGHLDPGCVLVAATGGIKVTGFGTAGDGPGESATPYTAPEGPQDERSDLFSVGAIAYEMLSGQAPTPGAQHAANAPLEARAFLSAVLAPDSARRPASADAARLLLLAPPGGQREAGPGGAGGLAWGAPPAPLPPPPAAAWGDPAAPGTPQWPAYGPPPGWGPPLGYGPPPGWGQPYAGQPYGVYAGQGQPAPPEGDARAELRARGQVFTAYPVWAIVVASLVTLGVFAVFWMAHWHTSLPRRSPRDPSGGQAIGFLFVPVFWWPWMVYSAYSLCGRLNAELAIAAPWSRSPTLLVVLMSLSQVAQGISFWVLGFTDPEPESVLGLAAGYIWLVALVLTGIGVGLLQSRVNALARYDRAQGGVRR